VCAEEGSSRQLDQAEAVAAWLTMTVEGDFSSVAAAQRTAVATESGHGHVAVSYPLGGSWESGAAPPGPAIWTEASQRTSIDRRDEPKLIGACLVASPDSDRRQGRCDHASVGRGGEGR
jgi:hypothetical protein